MGQVWHTPDSEWLGHLHRMGAIDNHCILDLGCGDGSFLHVASANGMFGIGIDISSVAINWARERRDKDRMLFLCVPAEKFTAPEEFDRIVSLGSFEHFLDRNRVLSNLRSMLKPQGIWYFQVPNDHWTAVDQPNECSMTTQDWTLEFTNADLQVRGFEEQGENSIIWGTK
jgi:2-polyprenyl-3-methyl-5-hydroxy-6-metoxy-1,4-benzoquinol methylase